MTSFEVDQPYGLLAMDRLDSSKCSQVRLRGSLAALRNSDLEIPWIGAVLVFGDIDCYHIRHTLAFIEPGSHNGINPFELQGSNGTDRSAHDITSVRPSNAGNVFGAAWSIQNQSVGTSLRGIVSPWTSNGIGANLCNQWVNGQVTTTPLWPWPMNQRIKDATAMAGAYSGPCPGCAGGRLARTALDVTTVVESLLGPIPETCRR
jgi:hypothetical protein